MSDIQVPRRPVTRDGVEETSLCGQWFTYDGVLGCVTDQGSNYVRFTYVPDGSYSRVATGQFLTEAKPVSDEESAQLIAEGTDNVRREIEDIQMKMMAAMNRVSLAAPTDETGLVLHSQRGSVDSYRKELQVVVKDSVPALKEATKKKFKELQDWLYSPMYNQEWREWESGRRHQEMQRRLDKLDVYAGLSENLRCLVKGDPAPRDTPITLVQQIRVMEEELFRECPRASWLVAHGREVELREEVISKWLQDPKVRDRILPTPRCVSAFLLQNPYRSSDDYRVLGSSPDVGRVTCLFFRNGDQIHYLTSKLQFGNPLLPVIPFGGWIQTFAGKVTGVVDKPSTTYSCTPFTPESLMYDDAMAFMDGSTNERALVLLTLQGLLDRSDVFSPHPPWSLRSDDADTFLKVLENKSLPKKATDWTKKWKAYCKASQDSIVVGTRCVGIQTFASRRWAKKNRGRFHKVGARGLTHWSYACSMGGPTTKDALVATKVTKDHVSFSYTVVDEWEGTEVEKNIRIPRAALLSADYATEDHYQDFFNADPDHRAITPLVWLRQALDREQGSVAHPLPFYDDEYGWDWY